MVAEASPAAPQHHRGLPSAASRRLSEPPAPCRPAFGTARSRLSPRRKTAEVPSAVATADDLAAAPRRLRRVRRARHRRHRRPLRRSGRPRRRCLVWRRSPHSTRHQATRRPYQRRPWPAARASPSGPMAWLPDRLRSLRWPTPVSPRSAAPVGAARPALALVGAECTGPRARRNARTTGPRRRPAAHRLHGSPARPPRSSRGRRP